MAPSSSLLFISFFCFYFLLASEGHAFRQPTKLFVFGDSYADTGNNIRKSIRLSWNPPYGITHPGKPAGRFSDGRVLPDFIATKLMGLESPLAYELMNLGGKKTQNGMNFAYGGSGVFDTFGGVVPNMSTQIGYFEKVEGQSLFTKRDLQSSLVLVCLDGNDYASHRLIPGTTPKSMREFVPRVINQLEVNLKRIQGLGATRIAVTALPPLGCLPQSSQKSSFKQCDPLDNAFGNHHNLLLQQVVSRLNNNTKGSTVFILDLYSAFNTVLQHRPDYQGNSGLERSLKPCCTGINSKDLCGSVDKRGKKMYTVCSAPKSSFFWDSFHPTDAGWYAVYKTLRPTLKQFIKLY